MIHAFLVFCMVLWTRTCSTVEIVPADHNRITSLEECMRAGMSVSSAEFDYNGSRWVTKGVRCTETHDEVAQWLSDRP